MAEWIMKGKDIRHKDCKFSDPRSENTVPVWYLKGKHYCLLCSMEPPEHIIIQWKLLNEE